MASVFDNLLRCFSLFILFVTFTHCSKLNVPRVLLPVFQNYNLNFTLEATDGGCYKWSTTRIDIIQLTPCDVDPDLECSTRAVVTGISKEQNRNIAVVFAEDIYTKQILRCDVILDVIDSLSVFSKTREIFMEEAPEAFDVRAFDSQGNEFTTLEGVELDWKLISSGPNKDASVVRFSTFKDSPYEIPETVKEIEEQGKKGHIVLLEGVKTGSAKVTVRLPQAEYEEVPMHEVQLSVVANLIITPPEVYIMVGDYVSFKIVHLNNGQMEEVPLPHSQYYLDVENKAIATSNIKTGEVTALKEGRTRVILHDRNVDEDEPGLKFPSAIFNVVQPEYMSLTILPHKNWAVFLSEHHEIVAEVYSSNDHKVYLGPGVEVHTQIGDAFHIDQRSVNGSWLYGWAKSEGTAVVQASLETIMHPKLGAYKLDPPLTATNEISIFPRIILEPSEIILPWDPLTRPKYDIDVVATGGDGKFLWTSSNHSVGVVSQQGKVKTHNMGFFEVSAAMQRNHHNRQTAKVHILPPSRLEIVEFVTEAEIGQAIYLHIALYAEKPGKDGSQTSHVPFTKCQDLSFKVKTSDNNFLYNKSDIVPPVGVSCANIAIVGRNVATSKVTVSYGKDLQHPSYPLEDSVTIGTYRPLKLIQPVCPEIVLAVGTTMHLIFTGGPRQPVGQPPSELKRTIKSSNNDTVDVFDVTKTYPGESDRTVLRVLCRKLGESMVTLSMANVPLQSSCANKESTESVNIVCGKPRGVFLQPEIKVANVESCPMELSSDRVVVQTYQDVELNVIVVDDVGRRFLNITSLKFKWEVCPQELGKVHSIDGTFQRLTDFGGGLMYGNSSYQLITPNATSGAMEVTGTIIGYHKKILSYFKIKAEWPEFVDKDEKTKELPPITYTVKLYLVDDAVVKPDFISLFNHPANKNLITVQQGSGYFEIALSTNDLAEVRYLESSHELEITPLADGELHITLVDLCLVSKPAVIIVNVVSVNLLRVEMSDKVEVGKCISCVVRMYDEADNILTLPDLDMLNLQVTLEKDIATVRRDDKSGLAEDGSFKGEIHYVITGVDLGDTKLLFAITGVDPEVTSSPVDLQVFPPLKLIPRNGTILVGAFLQFTSKGGPQPDATIEYVSKTESTAEISAMGLAKGLAIGKTKINARAVGINPTSGQKIIYSEDTVDLEVIALKGVKISAPLARFRIGATVPMWASGLPEQISPLILGTVEPSFQFNWTIEDPEIAEIKGVFQDTNIVYEPEDQVSIRVVGLQKGRTKISLVVTMPIDANCPKDKKVTVNYKHSLDLEVFEGLELIEPLGSSAHSVLMAPFSTIQIKTNMDNDAKLKYVISLKDESSNTNLQELGITPCGPVATVSDTGVLQSYGTVGHTMVILSATDDYGLRQTLYVIVEVKPIHYMMLNVHANWRVSCGTACTETTTIPVGTEFSLVSTYYDNSGREFTTGSIELRVRGSRFDLVRIRPGNDNSTFTVAIRKPGHTVIKSWAESDRKTADYVKLHTNQSITPLVDHFTVGDIICFSTPLRQNDLQSGVWVSTDENIIHVDATTGVAKVVGLKESTVFLQHSLHPAAPVHLKILPVNRIVLYPTTTGDISNSPSIFNIIPLVVEDELSFNKTSNVLGIETCLKHDGFVGLVGEPPFTCELKFSNYSVDADANEIFTIEKGFSPITGYSCNIRSGKLKSPEISIIESDVTVWATIDNTFISSEPLDIPFTPAIYVDEELILDESSFSGNLQIYGLERVLKEVAAEAKDKSLLDVGDPVWECKNLLTFEVRLLDYHWKLEELGDPLSINIISKVTDQTLKVLVRVPGINKFDRDQCAAGRTSAITAFFIHYRHTLTIIISMIVIFFVTFYAYSKYIQPVINVNVNPNRSFPGQPGSPSQTCRANAYAASFTPPTPIFCHNTSCGDASTNRQSSSVTRNSSSFGKNEPVYGDPSSFYCTSPEVRRNRRYF